jgi:DNA-binding NarL/FixJ family response regulator
MTPFSPDDQWIQITTSPLVQLVKEFDVVFGTSSRYEAFLFCLADKNIGMHGVLGAGCDVHEVEDLVKSAVRPVFLLLSDGLSKDAGVALLQRVLAKKPDTRAILMLNSLENYNRHRGALVDYHGLVSAGSVGRGGLLTCLETIRKGERYVDQLLQEASKNETSQWNWLNHREREILPLLARGLKNKEIAAELFLAETTTRDYVSSILGKLQVSNRAAAAAWAIEHGLTGG